MSCSRSALQAKYRKVRRQARPQSPPGTTCSGEIAAFIGYFAWRGKIFGAKEGVLPNKILPFGLSAIMAKVYKGENSLDGKECIVLGYSEATIVAQWIRDEMRLIGQNLYLGKAYCGKTYLIDFAPQF